MLEKKLIKFSEKLNEFKTVLENSNDLSVDAITQKLNLPRSEVALFKFKFSKLNESEINLLDNVDFKIEYEILGAICLCPDNCRMEMIQNLKQIQEAANPFEIMDEIMSKNREKHPLEDLSNSYWTEVANYLNERGIDNYPFNKAAIGFIKSVGWNGGFASQSQQQKDWILGLMKKDKAGYDLAKIFNNDVIKLKGLKKDFEIINKFYECL